ncbi:hypothetical protein AMTR_s00085p00022620 [Amborella trichopoda]|uniref:Uncharacterized protein n=1 Tax=Amborella trichopoda TaxID=13333 RepID=W1P3X8_AMBTC|nr:hypothetical protein AMTR_s00085p00022620 [Amborella trichopoda]
MGKFGDVIIRSEAEELGVAMGRVAPSNVAQALSWARRPTPQHNPARHRATRVGPKPGPIWPGQGRAGP